ncbi:SsrA-binding protein SmpB [Patescibacteria group bacterium]|nr:SsrA-binding protein SmpB [Patescibacteria group bacterium]MBU4274555.1 SsrA-binding protein SmpB [Patescibacteria group bacterium]MBU4367460.1 SsrA-binding protein SmpB [Patescibacteria group bacterium]MBU4461780.1 SsrA-binding protein SmpB [Patescibacteria group bacterium]MCG2700164.1 SsrA-binding protein SmpB [Candidatus Parcubacteria bacterium]
MKIFAENRKAKFNYNILEKFEAGMVLNGQEVKSIRLGRMTLDASYVTLKTSTKSGTPEPYLIGATIPAYQPKNAPANYNPGQSRKLLLSKSEIKHLIGKTNKTGLTLIPLRVYSNNAKIKLEFGIARGKKKYDKREDIKKREQEREIARKFGKI